MLKFCSVSLGVRGVKAVSPWASPINTGYGDPKVGALLRLAGEPWQGASTYLVLWGTYSVHAQRISHQGDAGTLKCMALHCWSRSRRLCQGSDAYQVTMEEMSREKGQVGTQSRSRRSGSESRHTDVYMCLCVQVRMYVCLCV